MTQIDPQQFGELKAQVAAQTEALRELSATVDAMRMQMAEARGGWRALMLIGGASSALGAVATWLLTHLTRGGPP